MHIPEKGRCLRLPFPIKDSSPEKASFRSRGTTYASTEASAANLKALRFATDSLEKCISPPTGGGRTGVSEAVRRVGIE
jgi:hypothetical protein